MPIVTLKQQSKRLEIGSFETDNQILFNYFDKLPSNERDEKLFKAFYIGVLALMEDRLSSFLSKTSNELGTELESLKIIFDMKKDLFYKTAIKGILAEEEIAEFLTEFFKHKKIPDEIVVTGNSTGKLTRNKTGDIVCIISNTDDIKIVIECKFDKSIKYGSIEEKDIFIKKSETAWSQLLESAVNREAKVSIIVFDISLIDNSISKTVTGIKYVPEVGFVIIIDSSKGDYNNLAIAYLLARDIAINSKKVELDNNILSLLITRIIKDITEITGIRDLVKENINQNLNILKKLEKGILLLECNRKYLLKFLEDGQLTKDDLLAFYLSDEVKDEFKISEKLIDSILSQN